MAAVLIALALVFFMFDTRIGALALLVAIVLLYQGNTSKRLEQVRKPARDETPRPMTAWKDPWGTESSGTDRS